MRVLARLWSISEEVSVSGVLLGFVVWCVWHHIFTPVAVFLSSFGDCLSSTFDNGAASSLDSFAASDLSDWPLPHPSWWRTCLEITWGTFWFSEDDQSTPFLLWSCGLRYQLHYIHYIHYSLSFRSFFCLKLRSEKEDCWWSWPEGTHVGNCRDLWRGWIPFQCLGVGLLLRHPSLQIDELSHRARA